MNEEKKPKNPESISLAMLRAEVLAQGCLLQALASSHPDKAALREHFTYYTEQYISGTLAGGAADASIGLFEMSAGRLMAFIDGA